MPRPRLRCGTLFSSLRSGGHPHGRFFGTSPSLTGDGPRLLSRGAGVVQITLRPASAPPSPINQIPDLRRYSTASSAPAGSTNINQPRTENLSPTTQIRITPGHVELIEKPQSSSTSSSSSPSSRHPSEKLAGPSRISYTRLREACACPQCLDPSTRQRSFTLGQAYEDVVKSGFNDITPSPGQVFVRISPDAEPVLEAQWDLGHSDPTHSNASSGHSSTYGLEELRRLIDPSRVQSQSATVRRPWDTSDTLHKQIEGRKGKNEGSFQYKDLRRRSEIESESGVDFLEGLGLLTQLDELGIAIIKGVPTQETTDATCSLREVAGWIGPIRNTFYGEVWNVINLQNDSKNVAYTNKDLGLHMDLL